MGTRLNWERSNMRKKVRDQGSVDGRFATEKNHMNRAMSRSKAKARTDKDRRSLHYIFTGKRI